MSPDVSEKFVPSWLKDSVVLNAAVVQPVVLPPPSLPVSHQVPVLTYQVFRQ